MSLPAHAPPLVVRRVLVAAITIVLATGAAVTAGPTSLADADSPVAISAAPRWGNSIPGTWTPYVVTVKNDGTTNVDGDVVLVPEAPPAPPGSAPGGAGQIRQIRPIQARPDDRVPTFDTYSGVAPRRGPGRAAMPTPPPWPTYRSHLTLAAGAAKTRTVLVVEAPWGYRVELQGSSGRRMASAAATAPPPNRGSYAVAILTRVAGGDAVVGGQPGLFASAVTVTQVSSARDFPDDALLLGGLDTLIIDDFDTASLDAKQIRALEDYVAFGGSLVLGGGAAWPRTLGALPDELVPLRPSATVSSTLNALADLGGRTTEATATVATGELRSGRAVVGASSGPPLVVEEAHGSGEIVQLAYDPFAQPFASDSALAGLAWDQALARGLFRAGRVVSGPTRIIAPEDYLWAPVLETNGTLWPSWPAWNLAVLGAYGLLLGPATYLLLRSRRRGFLWAAIPVTALLVAGAAGLPGRRGQVPPQRIVQVKSLSPDGAVLTTTYRRLLTFGAGGKTTLTLRAVDAASTVFVAPGVNQAGETFIDERVSRGAGGGQIASEAGRSAELELGATGKDIRSVQTVSLDHRAGGIEATLRLVGTPVIGRGNRMVGTVTNRGAEPLHRLTAQLPEGVQAFLAGVVPSGTTVAVDAPLSEGAPPPTAELSPQRNGESEVMFAAASRSFMRPGQVALVALGERPAGADRSSIRVIAQALPLAGAGAMPAHSSPVASSLGPTGWVTVYEADVLPGAAPGSSLHLVTGQTVTGVEVYDWSSTTWRQLSLSEAAGGAGALTMTQGELSHGIVRFRVRSSSELGTKGAALQVEPSPVTPNG